MEECMWIVLKQFRNKKWLKYFFTKPVRTSDVSDRQFFYGNINLVSIYCRYESVFRRG